MVKRFLAQIALISDSSAASFWERVGYVANTVVTLTPIAFVLDLANWWFTENRQFGSFICMALVVNMLVGAVTHFKAGTFCFRQFLLRNIEMGFIVVVVYIMLEMLRYTAGHNLAGDLFRVSIQIMSLLYPTSKVLKNVYILTRGAYPPEFLMKKLYDFEKSGDLNKLFGNGKNTGDIG